MDLNDMTHPYTPGAQAGPASYLLVWDAPNIDMGLGAILGGRPAASHRPRFDAIGRWLITQAQLLADETSERIEPEATVFTNVSQQGAEAVRPWVEALRNMGFAVFAKPKSDEDSDVDVDMVAHIERRHAEGVLRGVVIASADGQNFIEPIAELTEVGIPVTVLGFHEHAAWAVNSKDVRFVDLEDIPGVFRDPLPRVNLDALPEGGAWLQPFRPLVSLLSNTREHREH
ncbi:NYN domain-containing protein [Corynebacterium aquatimens]|uniref:NYN domain-containing protein n=1 Tax=Corynebacterium TaxID=1716 RepID=UPI001F2D7AE5|nr:MULTISPECIES: NYN domain-containing protein [Corynebacterium]QYH19124.1 NYN domain-containing protein [Corynebacterium aquatimens]UIZ92007.1 NYN domain-containing protein [Corynebacterium sp. CNCTC7651]